MKRSIVIPLIMFAFILSIFYISPPQPPSDSYYTLLVSETLLTKGRLWLDDCFKQPLNPGRYPGINETGYPYQVEIKRGHIYNSYPLGNAFLCVPIAAVAKMMGYSFHFKNGVYHAANEERVQQIAASFLMAFLCLVWYRTANRFLPDSWSVGIAIVMTLGTSVWSTLSRALWMDTWGILIQSLVIDRFVAVRISGARFRPLLVATLCSWSFMIKPTYCIFIVVISIYILMVHRVHFLSFASTGVFWLGVFIGSSLWNNGQILPSENTNATFLFRWQNIPEGFAGILISPARGLFVYSPMLLVAGYLLIKYWKKLPLHDLTKTALLFSALHVFLVSSYALWWAGFSYGPRYMAPLLPWFLLVIVQGLAGSAESIKPNGRYSPHLGVGFQLSAGSLIIVSVWMHGHGIFSVYPHLWNEMPRNVNLWTTRAWDWRYPPFLAGIINVPPPLDYRVLTPGRPILMTQPDCLQFLWEGWGTPGATGCWMIDNRARVFFALREKEHLIAQMTLRPYIHTPEITSQRLQISFNGTRIGDLILRSPEKSVFAFSLPIESMRVTNDLMFEAPDARPARESQKNTDMRRLSVLVSEILIKTEGS